MEWWCLWGKLVLLLVCGWLLIPNFGSQVFVMFVKSRVSRHFVQCWLFRSWGWHIKNFQARFEDVVESILGVTSFPISFCQLSKDLGVNYLPFRPHGLLIWVVSASRLWRCWAVLLFQTPHCQELCSATWSQESFAGKLCMNGSADEHAYCTPSMIYIHRAGVSWRLFCILWFLSPSGLSVPNLMV